MNAAEMLKRALAGTQGHRPEPITDEFAKAIAERLEKRGIAKVPGLPADQTEPSWYELVVEYARSTRELEAKRAVAAREAEQADTTTTAPQTTAGIIRRTIALNGDGVLKAAAGTVGGMVYDRGDSVAALIEAEIQRGRHE